MHDPANVAADLALADSGAVSNRGLPRLDGPEQPREISDEGRVVGVEDDHDVGRVARDVRYPFPGGPAVAATELPWDLRSKGPGSLDATLSGRRRDGDARLGKRSAK